MLKLPYQLTEQSRCQRLSTPRLMDGNMCGCFDHSSCHSVMSDDALDASKMNVNPGGKQRVMRETVWKGKVHKMNYWGGVPKGTRAVLTERGVDTSRMKAEDLRAPLAEMDDFKNEKSLIEHYLVGRRYIPIFLPKFHLELNPIKRVWAQLKWYTKAYFIVSIHFHHSARISQICLWISFTGEYNHFRKVRHFMFAYLPGLAPGKESIHYLKNTVFACYQQPVDEVSGRLGASRQAVKSKLLWSPTDELE